VSKDNYNEKTLREYLLGLLPEADTERLDELSVTEEKFAQDLRRVEDDLIDAYVNDELTGRELLHFPRQYLRSQLGVERVRFAQALRDSNQLRDEQDPETEVETRPIASARSLLSFGDWSTLKWGLVTASLLICLIVSWFIFQQLRQPNAGTPQLPDGTAKSERQGSSEPDPKANEKPTPTGDAKIDPEHQAQQSPTPQANPPSPSRVVAFVLKPQLRTVSQPVELTIPNHITTVALTLQLEPGDTTYYRPILTEASSDRAVWQGGSVKSTTTDGMSVLQVRVPGALLTQGAYKIRVVGVYPDGTTETTSEYNFRIVR